MKKVAKVVEVEGEGLEALLGQKVILLCANFFYSGVLTGVNETCVQLEHPRIVYDTGSWKAESHTNSEELGVDFLYVQTAAIEAFCEEKK